MASVATSVLRAVTPGDHIPCLDRRRSLPVGLALPNGGPSMRSIRRSGLAFSVALLLAGPAFGAERIKVFIDQDTSGPGGTDSVSIAMLLLAPHIEGGGLRVGAGAAGVAQAVSQPLK